MLFVFVDGVYVAHVCVCCWRHICIMLSITLIILADVIMCVIRVCVLLGCVQCIRALVLIRVRPFD